MQGLSAGPSLDLIHKCAVQFHCISRVFYLAPWQARWNAVLQVKEYEHLLLRGQLGIDLDELKDLIEDIQIVIDHGSIQLFIRHPVR